MTEKAKRKRSPQGINRPLAVHFVTSTVLLSLLLYIYLKPNPVSPPTSGTLLVNGLFQVICAVLSVAIGMANKDWERLTLRIPSTKKVGVPVSMLLLILPMTFFSGWCALMFLALQPAALWWRIVQLLGCFGLPFFIARETFHLGRFIAIKRQQKSKIMDEIDDENVIGIEDQHNATALHVQQAATITDTKNMEAR